jgi:hypothetical protein
VVDRRLHDDLRKTYLHVRAPRFDLHRLQVGEMVANKGVNQALTLVEAWGHGDQGVRRMQISHALRTGQLAQKNFGDQGLPAETGRSS